MTWGLRRLDAVGLAAAAVGLGLFSRAIANVPMSRLTGVEAGRRAIPR